MKLNSKELSRVMLTAAIFEGIIIFILGIIIVSISDTTGETPVFLKCMLAFFIGSFLVTFISYMFVDDLREER